jgi:hypothetical protein
MDVLNPGREGRELQAEQVARQRKDMMGLIAAGIIKAPPPSAPQVIAPTPQPRPVEGFGTDETQLPAWLVEKPRSVGPTEAPAQPLVPEGLISERIPEMAVPTPAVQPLSPEERRQAVLETAGAQKAEPWIPGLPVGAALTGAARTASLGLTDVMSTDLDKAAARAMRKYSPIATTVGEIGGIFTPGGLPSLIGKGVVRGVARLAGRVMPEAFVGGLAAEQSANLTRAAITASKVVKVVQEDLLAAGVATADVKAIATAMRLRKLSTVPQAVERGVAEEIASRGASGTLPTFWQGAETGLGKAGLGLAESAAVGAGLGAGQAVSRQALGESPVSGMDILKTAGIGAGFNAGFSLVGSLLGIAVKPAIQKLFLRRSGLEMSDVTARLGTQLSARTDIDRTAMLFDKLGKPQLSSEFRELAKQFSKGSIAEPEMTVKIADLASRLGTTDATSVFGKLAAPGQDIIKVSGDTMKKAVTRLANADAKMAEGATAFAKAVPSLKDITGFGSGVLGIGTYAITHNPTTATIAFVGPWILKKALGNPFVADGFMEKAVKGVWNMMGPLSSYAGVRLLKPDELDTVKEDLKEWSIDQERLAKSLQNGGMDQRDATNFAAFQQWRLDGIRSILAKPAMSAVDKARAAYEVQGLVDPRIPLARMANGTQSAADIKVIREIMMKFEPEAWKLVTEDALKTIARSKTEMVGVHELMLAKQLLGQGSGTTIARRAAFQSAPSMGSGPPAYQKAIRQTRLDIGKIVGDLTPAQRLMRGIGQ